MNNNNKNVSQPEFSLFVGDLPSDCSEDTLERLFQSRFKSVKKVQIIRNGDRSSRCFGFIRFVDQTDFKAALSQEMKIGNTTLRLDAAHINNRHKNTNRGRYNSFNSSVSNSSNQHNHHHFNNSNSNLHHHHHHHNQSHHHPEHHPHSQHRHQHGNQQNQSGGGANNNNNNKTLLSDNAPGNQHHQQPGANHQATSGRNINNNSNNSSNNNSNPPHAGTVGTGQHQGHQQQQPSAQQHHNASLGHNLYNNNPQKNSHQPSPDAKLGSKQINLSLSDDTNKLLNQTPQQPQTQSQPLPTQQAAALISSQAPPTQQPPLTRGQQQSQHTLPQVPNNPVGVGSQVAGVNLTASTTTAAATTTTPITSVNSHSAAAAAAAAMHNSQQNLNTTHQQAIGPDLRGYVHPALMDSHLMVAAEQPSVVPPTSVYGHMYPYGPPAPFGYMPPPPQPNPLMPISAVPPAPPNPASLSGSVGQQHSLTGSAVNANRFNSAQQPSHHHSQPQHHPHHHQPQQQAHVSQTGMDANSMGAMAGGVQPTHQGPFYYYYHSPLYFDQTGGAAGAPPNHMYHPQTFHPQFFALPGPAYLPPNAHTFNQHQAPQPPTAPQSDATLLNQHPQQQQAVLQPPPPPHPQQQQQPQQTKDR